MHRAVSHGEVRRGIDFFRLRGEGETLLLLYETPARSRAIEARTE